MKQRLIQFLSHIGMGQKAFEQKTGLSNGFVNNVGDSIREVSLTKISAKYPELNLNWLKTGEGGMLKTTQQQNSDTVTIPRQVFDQIAELSEVKKILAKYNSKL